LNPPKSEVEAFVTGFAISTMIFFIFMVILLSVNEKYKKELREIKTYAVEKDYAEFDLDSNLIWKNETSN
jgi:hypothetical protein